MTRALLIDGDILIFKVLYSVEERTHWGDDFWTWHCDLKEARAALNLALADMAEDLKADYTYIAFSADASGYFRKDIFPEYKAQRAKQRKPVCYPQLRDYAMEKYDCFRWPRLEADDVLGILSDCEGIKGDQAVIVSEDKDLLTIPGIHYTDKEGEFWVSEDVADFRFLMQTLTGDRVDGYPGCPGVGPKTAEKILGNDKTSILKWTAWGRVVNAFKEKGLTEDDALLQARMARILRPGEYDRETGEVRLWQSA